MLLRQKAQATSDANGAATFTFPTVQTNQSWVGTIAIPTASATSSFLLTLDSDPHGGWGGPTPFGPVYVQQGEQAIVTANGLVPNTVYTARFIGSQQNAGLQSPPSPVPFPSTGVLGPNGLVAFLNSSASGTVIAAIPGKQVVIGTVFLQPGIASAAAQELLIQAIIDAGTVDLMSAYAGTGPQPGVALPFSQGLACDVDTALTLQVIGGALASPFLVSVSYLLVSPVTPS